jgi:hypothetical protein
MSSTILEENLRPTRTHRPALVNFMALLWDQSVCIRCKIGLSAHHTSKFSRTIRKPVLRGIWTFSIGLESNTTIVNGYFSEPSGL